jgi:hypothetical protein
MAQSSNNNWIWWTLGSLAVIGLGVGGFIFVRNRKNKKGEEKKQEGSGSGEEGGGSSNIFTNIGNIVSETLGSGGGTSDPPTPFKTREEGNKFRAWVRSKYPDYAREIVLDEQGKYDNDTIRKAWAKYGQEWLTEAERMRNTPQGSDSGGVKGDNYAGWNAIKTYLSGTLSKDYNNSTSYEQVFYMIDVPISIADWVVHLKEDGNLYFGEQTYGQDKNQQWGKWGYFRKPDGTGYWSVEMSNGKGNGTSTEIAPLLKNVFEAQYPDITAKYKKEKIWNNFSDLVLTKKKGYAQGSGDVLDNNL